tara:strand:+ start:801 stop:1544 length:744 start_codon:yes stop_codon:yes gene_type:complete
MKKDSVSVILTVYKRNNILKQLNSIKTQSIKPKNITIYQNENHFNVKEIIKNFDTDIPINIITSENNLKFHARFCIALLEKSEFICIFDDDTIPGKNWLLNCINTHKKYNCIVGANGRIVKDDYKNYNVQRLYNVGDGKEVAKDTKVDFVGHSWFFKKEWLFNMWSEDPLTWENGEDIHFAALNKIKANIDCYVPKMTIEDKSYWGDLETHLGDDLHATFKKQDHNSTRASIIKIYIKNYGWKIINA